MSFLKAEWRKLALANYAVTRKSLEPYLPAGTELDLWNDTCYVSLVGFMFVNTRLMGIPIPFHTDFEEVNLRFYVKRLENGEWRRGVVFIQEIVPKPAITFIANTVYKEHYRTRKMRHNWSVIKDSRHIDYSWKTASQWNSFKLVASESSAEIPVGSEEEFITEHYWGYTKITPSKTTAYEVTHPRWKHYPVSSYEINVNFRETYGEAFSFLDSLEPVSVMLAEGSEITVENKMKITTS